MSGLLSVEQVIDQVCRVLSEPYGEQAEKFVFDLIVFLVQKGDINAALAAISARPIPQPAQRCLEMVFATADDLKRVRSQTDLLAAMAQRESISLLLRLESGQGRTPISPLQARKNLRNTTMSSPVIALPGIQVAQMRFSPPLFRVLMEFLEHPDRACGLVELSTQRQLMITESSARMILQEDFTRLMDQGREDLVRERVAAATSLRREDYFADPADLQRFEVMTRELEPNNPDSSREITWTGISRAGGLVDYTHRYWIVQDDRGFVYHVGQNIAFEPVPVAA